MQTPSPIQYNWSIWRGNDRRISLRFSADLTGYSATISYRLGGVSINRPMTISASTDFPGRYVVYTDYTPLETKQFVYKQDISYEIILQSPSGKKQTYMSGLLRPEGTMA